MTKQINSNYWDGGRSNITKPTTLMSKDNTSWKKLWKDCIGEDQYPGELPKGTMAVAIFCGEKKFETKPEINSLPLNGQDIEIIWSEREDSKKPISNHSPYVIMLIGKFDGKVTFTKQKPPAPYKPKGPTPKHLRKSLKQRIFGK